MSNPTADPKAAKEMLDRWQEYEAAEAECCPVCGSFSPSHIQEDDDGPCREVPPLSQYLR